MSFERRVSCPKCAFNRLGDMYAVVAAVGTEDVYTPDGRRYKRAVYDHKKGWAECPKCHTQFEIKFNS